MASDYRDFLFEVAAKCLPQAFVLAKGPCGGEAVILAPDQFTAREGAARIWNNGQPPEAHVSPEEFKCVPVPVVLMQAPTCMGRGSPGPDGVAGDSAYFGSVDEVREALMTPMEEAAE